MRHFRRLKHQLNQVRWDLVVCVGMMAGLAFLGALVLIPGFANQVFFGGH